MQEQVPLRPGPWSPAWTCPPVDHDPAASAASFLSFEHWVSPRCQLLLQVLGVMDPLSWQNSASSLPSLRCLSHLSLCGSHLPAPSTAVGRLCLVPAAPRFLAQTPEPHICPAAAQAHSKVLEAIMSGHQVTDKHTKSFQVSRNQLNCLLN